jgi:starvation-inducible DNA-binding protein
MNKNDAHISQELLNKLLANESVLLMQTLNYHWNLVGPEFHDYHLLFDKQYNQLFADMDKIAERVRAVQGQALGSFKNILATASMKEDSGKAPKPKQMIVNLLKQYEALIEQIRAAIVTLDKKTTDFGTINFLEELITQHEKTAWMLRSLTEK